MPPLATLAYSNSQLAFVATVSLLLYAIFIFVQTIRHRDYFLPQAGPDGADARAIPPSKREMYISVGALARAARRNRLQTSLNLVLGSALASIGFTISGCRHHIVVQWLDACTRVTTKRECLAGLGATRVRSVAQHRTDHGFTRRSPPDDLHGLCLHSCGSVIPTPTVNYECLMLRF